MDKLEDIMLIEGSQSQRQMPHLGEVSNVFKFIETESRRCQVLWKRENRELWLNGYKDEKSAGDWLHVNLLNTTKLLCYMYFTTIKNK